MVLEMWSIQTEEKLDKQKLLMINFLPLFIFGLEESLSMCAT